MTNPAYTISRFRWRSGSDTGGIDATPTWTAGENVCINVDVTSGNVLARLRVTMQETAGRSAAATTQLRTSIDAFAAAITTSSSGVKAIDISSSADDTSLTVARLTAGTGTFYNGQYDETGTTGSVTDTSSGYTEYEFAIQLVAADLTDGQIIEFQPYTAATAPAAITFEPRIIISKSSSFGSLLGAAGVFGTVTQKLVVASGQLLFAMGTSGTATAPSAISDTLGNAWTALNAGGVSGGNYAMRAWYSICTVGGETAVTITSGVANTTFFQTFQGPFEASPVDSNPAIVTADTSSPYPGNPTGTLAQANELIISYFGQRTASTQTVAGGSFVVTDTQTTTNSRGSLAHEIVSSTANQTATWTGPNVSTVQGIVSFKQLVSTPDPPTGLTATASSSSTINLSWTSPATGSAPTGYKIERESPVGGGFSTLVADTGTTATTYPDTSCAATTQYNYRVSSINSAGTSSASTAANDTTPAAATDVGIVTSFGFGRHTSRYKYKKKEE